MDEIILFALFLGTAFVSFMAGVAWGEGNEFKRWTDKTARPVYSPDEDGTS